jgi:two-component system, NarL family, nitrate/nitrite response regulator NarL
MEVSDQCKAQVRSALEAGDKVATVLVSRSSTFGAGLRLMLSGTRFAVLEKTFKSVAALPSFLEAVPVLAVVDASGSSEALPEMVGQLKTQCPYARVAVLADHFEPRDVLSAHRAGATGFFQTTVRCDVLAMSLPLLMLGETIFPSDMALAAMQALSLAPRHEIKGSPVRAGSLISGSIHELSHRELEILRCLTEGAQNKTIAQKFAVAEATVKVHVKAILKKLGAANRTQAALWASDYFHEQSSRRAE